MKLNDFYRKVLEKLTVVASGTAADPDDLKTVREKYASVYDMLDAADLVTWTSDADLPNEVVEPLVSMLAFASAREFGQDPQSFAAEGALFAPVPSLAERQLRRIISANYISQPQATEYF